MEFLVDILASEALQAVLTNAFLALVTGVIGALGTWVVAFVKSKLNANQLELLDQIAASVVLAVEQSTYGTELANDAIAKKSAAMDMISEYLKKYGINVSEEILDATVEAAVANVLNANKLIEPPKVVEVEGPSGPFMN